MFTLFQYATDPDLAGIYVDYEDVKSDGPCYMLRVLGSEIWYDVTFLYGIWFCQPCIGFNFRKTCSHVDRGKRFIEKRGALNVSSSFK
jgi:hypothetical protein